MLYEMVCMHKIQIFENGQLLHQKFVVFWNPHGYARVRFCPSLPSALLRPPHLYRSIHTHPWLVVLLLVVLAVVLAVVPAVGVAVVLAVVWVLPVLVVFAGWGWRWCWRWCCRCADA